MLVRHLLAATMVAVPEVMAVRLTLVTVAVAVALQIFVAVELLPVTACMFLPVVAVSAVTAVATAVGVPTRPLTELLVSPGVDKLAVVELPQGR